MKKWHIKPRPRTPDAWNLFYGDAYMGQFKDEGVAELVVDFLTVSGATMEVTPPVLADDPPGLELHTIPSQAWKGGRKYPEGLEYPQPRVKISE